MLAWDDADGITVCGLLVAALSHHGRPLQRENPNIGKNPSVWQPYGGLHPQAQVERIGRLVRQWFPEAFEPDAPALPSAPDFQRHFLGLCNLADWIGSNEKWFGYVDTPQGSALFPVVFFRRQEIVRVQAALL